MRSSRRLEPQPWMTAPETATVMAALAAGGAEARFVGGCVRDAVLGRAITDIDIATPEPPTRVTELLEGAGIQVVPTGIKHGTVTAVIAKRHFEITTLRRDVETYGRHAKIEFTDDWEADAARRDFTFNAMFCAADGALYDAFGGIADLEARRVRFVGEAEARIREDVLRLLRFFRFYAHYGAAPPDPEALAACRDLAHLLPTLSGERVREETLKLLRATTAGPVLELMRDQGVLARFLAEATRLDRLDALVAIEAAAPRDLVPSVDAVRRLAALLDGSEQSARDVATRLRFSNADCRRLTAMAKVPAPTVDLPAPAARRLIYGDGAAAFRDRVLVAWADRVAAGGAPGRGEVDGWVGLLRLAAEWQAPAFPLKGRDAVTIGIPRGPAVGGLMQRLEAWWIAGDFQADRKACLAKLRELATSA